MQDITKRVWGALLLGPLTLFITPLVALVVVVPFFLLSLLSVKTNLVVVATKVLHLEGSGLGGYFLAIMAVGILLVLLGNSVVAFISYRIFRSRSLAMATLASAFLTQAVAIGWTLYTGPRQTADYVARMDAASAEFDRALREYASIGDVRFEASEPLDGFIDNAHPELGPVYRKLTFLVPVTVRHAGAYHLYVRYRARADSVEFHTGMLEAVDTLAVGEHIVPVEFDGRNAGYPPVWSPASMGGETSVELYVDVDRMRLLRFYESKTKGSKLGGAGSMKEWEADAKQHPWMEMPVDSAATVFAGGVRYPKTSRWAPAPKPSRLTDKQEEELRRRTHP